MASLKRATKMLTKALEDPRYNYDQYVEILKRRHQVKKLRKNLQDYERASRGFGYTVDPAIFEQSISEVNNIDSESGGDDGLRSESEQPIESGQPEDLGAS
jgi:hypothetical protein